MGTKEPTSWDIRAVTCSLPVPGPQKLSSKLFLYLDMELIVEEVNKPGKGASTLPPSVAPAVRGARQNSS